MSGRLNGKIAIITGAGSRGPGLGNGKATAILFAREGAKVFCVDQMKERAEETVGAIRAEGGEATAHAADVTRAAECAAMVRVAVQLGPKGIRVNAIAPGPVWTPMVQDLGSEARERRRRASPLGTEGTGWDIGWGAVYLASDEARWVTGQTLIIDAGLTVTTPEGTLGDEAR